MVELTTDQSRRCRNLVVKLTTIQQGIPGFQVKGQNQKFILSFLHPPCYNFLVFVICAGLREGYKELKSCKNGINSIKKNAPTAKIVEE